MKLKQKLSSFQATKYAKIAFFRVKEATSNRFIHLEEYDVS